MGYEVNPHLKNKPSAWHLSRFYGAFSIIKLVLAYDPI